MAPDSSSEDDEMRFRNAQDPSAVYAWVKLGAKQLDSGEVKAAEDSFRRALAIDRAEQHAQCGLAWSLFKAEKFRDAIASFQEFLQQNAYESEVGVIMLGGLGAAYRGTDELDKARAAFEKILDLVPDHTEAMLNVALCIRDNEPLEAIDFLRRAIQLEPDYALAHAELGSIYAKQHRYEEAMREYRRAIELDSTKPWHHVFLGATASKIGEVELAEHEYRRALECDPDDGIFPYLYGKFLARLGRESEAEDQFKAAIALEPECSDYALSYAKLLASIGRDSEASKWSQKGAELLRIEEESD